MTQRQLLDTALKILSLYFLVGAIGALRDIVLYLGMGGIQNTDDGFGIWLMFGGVFMNLITNSLFFWFFAFKSDHILEFLRMKITFSTFILLLTNFQLIACSCMGTETTKEAVKRSTLVFTGKVISVEPYEIENIKLGDKFIEAYSIIEITFEVYDNFKNNAVKWQKIYTGTGGGDCGFNFEAGKEYLVYATNDGVYLELSSEFFQTDICSRTQELTYLKEEIEILTKLKRKKSW